MTCHVGVPSCGQRHRNTFTYLISHLYYHPQHIPSPCLHSRTFLFFPTHPLLHMTTFWHLIPGTQTQPGRGSSVEGVHPPTPSAFAPWSSRRLVACFHAPRRLLAWLIYSTCDCAKIRKEIFALSCSLLVDSSTALIGFASFPSGGLNLLASLLLFTVGEPSMADLVLM